MGYLQAKTIGTRTARKDLELELHERTRKTRKPFGFFALFRVIRGPMFREARLAAPTTLCFSMIIGLNLKRISLKDHLDFT
jgi:hypothetical protein